MERLRTTFSTSQHFRSGFLDQWHGSVSLLAIAASERSHTQEGCKTHRYWNRHGSLEIVGVIPSGSFGWPIVIGTGRAQVHPSRACQNAEKLGLDCEGSDDGKDT